MKKLVSTSALALIAILTLLPQCGEDDGDDGSGVGASGGGPGASGGATSRGGGSTNGGMSADAGDSGVNSGGSSASSGGSSASSGGSRTSGGASASGGGAGASTGGMPVEVPDEVVEFIEAYCDALAPCCAEVELPSDGVGCRALVATLVPGLVWQQGPGQVCLEWLRAAPTRAGFCDTLFDDTPQECDEALVTTGSQAPGEDCSEDTDCASTDDGEAACANGFVEGVSVSRCQIRLPGGEGDSPCVGQREGSTITFGSAPDVPPTLGYICDVRDGVYCDGTSCAPLTTVGGDCFDSSECVRTAYCDGTTCASRKESGVECSGDIVNECVARYDCDLASGTCAALSGPGDACETGSQCLSGICEDLACVGNDNLVLSILCAE